MRTAADHALKAQVEAVHKSLRDEGLPAILSRDQAAKALGLCGRSVARMIHRGELRGFRVGGERLRVRRLELAKFIASRELRV